ncbi:MAG: 2,3-diaminopropionate biosynthesis protein SbnB [Desulfobacteraceae bacterium]|nr:2,3-diaminopropionate biosynthesis protein SbnB [Desulfobacteraceae bacterium]
MYTKFTRSLTMQSPENFTVVPGTVVNSIIAQMRVQIIDEVRCVYLLHQNGKTINPDSYFLRFPDRLDSRIIALPAALRGQQPFSGIKWIASYPKNIEMGLSRASAVLLLNDYETGYPFACLEASTISAARTAASAVLAAGTLAGEKRSGGRICFIGAGIIAKTILDFFVSDDWNFNSVVVHDLNTDYGNAFTSYVESVCQTSTHFESSLDKAIAGADLVVFATTALKPHVSDPQTFNPGQVVLHISLRDLVPEIILQSWNIVDDVEHCLKADTSPHLAEQATGNRDFIAGTLAEVLMQKINLDRSRPLVFSPFGLGVLDLAVGARILQQAVAMGEAVTVPGFFGNVRRWA